METVLRNTPSERRRSRRHVRPEEHRILSARVRPGYDVSVIDVSAGGALVESDRRLLPGAPVELHLRTDQRSEIVRGRIVRCAVTRLRANAVCYRGAIAFDHTLLWLVDESAAGYLVPVVETRPRLASGAGATPGLL
jgi:PilZ domain-containing protein